MMDLSLTLLRGAGAERYSIYGLWRARCLQSTTAYTRAKLERARAAGDVAGSGEVHVKALMSCES